MVQTTSAAAECMAGKGRYRTFDREGEGGLAGTKQKARGGRGGGGFAEQPYAQ